MKCYYFVFKEEKRSLFLSYKYGFTLVEMLVSIAVFMTVMVIAIGSFISITNANKKSQIMKSVVDNVTFAVDNISRSIKLGYNYKCAENSSKNILNFTSDGNCTGGGNAIQYYNPILQDYNYIQYIYIKSDSDELGENEGNIQKRSCINDNSGCTEWQSLTGPVNNINIKNMKFYVLGVGTDSFSRSAYRERRQPRVIITVEGSSADNNMFSSTNFMLQTSISQTKRVIE